MKISENVLVIIAIFTFVAFSVYMYFGSEDNTYNIYHTQHLNYTAPEKKVVLKDQKKKVRFDNNVKCAYYTKLPNETKKRRNRELTPMAPVNFKSDNMSEIESDSDSGDVFASSSAYESVPRVKSCRRNNLEADNKRVNEIINSVQKLPRAPTSLTKSEYPIKTPIPKKSDDLIETFVSDNTPKNGFIPDAVMPPKVMVPSDTIIESNLDLSTVGDTWDASFGMPLMSQKEQADYFAKMMNNFSKYKEAVGEFYEYVTDQKAVLKTDTTIDPFQPSKTPEKYKSLKGKTVGEIYDEQVSGPHAKSKEIRKVTKTETFYEDESDMNGGIIPGTKLFGFDGSSSNKMPASFGNGF